MKDQAPPPLSNSSVLCFDYGTRTIGVAVGQSVTHSASPLNTLPARDGIPDWDQIGKLLDEWKPLRVLVGLPLNMDGTESELSVRARKFANRIHGRFGIAVAMVDERLSSFEARGEIIQQTGSRDFKKHGIDSLAAKLILESWWQSQR